MKKKHVILPLSAVLKIILTNLCPAHFHFSFLARFKGSSQGAATFGYSAETFVRIKIDAVIKTNFQTYKC